MSKFKIGLEIHVRLKTDHKLFSSSKSNNTSISNINIGLYDIGTPGTFPILNHEVIAPSIKACILMQCSITKEIEFDRKHYMYPDLPLGFQLTQDRNPIGQNGIYYINNIKYIRIDNIHIEADAAKIKGYDNKITIDFNRCGSPLIEIVTMPDFTDEEEVCSMLALLINDIKINNISSAQLEMGDFRVDVNISHAESKSNNRIEIKNLNSMRSIKNAIKSAKEKIMGNNKIITNSITAHYNEATKQIEEARDKENKHDYWYMPEHSMPIFSISDKIINSIQVTRTINIIEKIQSITNNQSDENNIMAIVCNEKLLKIILHIMKDTYTDHIMHNIIMCMTQLQENISKSKNNIDNIAQNIVSYSKILTSKKATKIDLTTSIKEALDKSSYLDDILKKNNLYITLEANDETKQQIIKYIKQNEKLFTQIKNKDKKALSFGVGYVKKAFKNISPQTIKEIINNI